MIELKNIEKSFEKFSIRNLNLAIEKGDYFIILGKSGAGKSLILEMIAGLVMPDNGRIFRDGRDISYLPIQKRNIGIVFQDNALFPHMTVKDNLLYPLSCARLRKESKRNLIKKMASELEIDHLLNRNPESLSGGEKRRVALARTLVLKPDILLLDEPLVSLDAQMRGGIRSLLRKIHKAGQTIIHVTHDYEETLSLADKIAVLNNGIIVQQGSPAEVFRHPGSPFVASFIGIKNFFPVDKVIFDKDHSNPFAVLTNGIKIKLPESSTVTQGNVIIRGEDIILTKTPQETSATNCFKGTVSEIMGSQHGIEVQVDIGITLTALISSASREKLKINEGDEIYSMFKAAAVRFVPS